MRLRPFLLLVLFLQLFLYSCGTFPEGRREYPVPAPVSQPAGEKAPGAVAPPSAAYTGLAPVVSSSDPAFRPDDPLRDKLLQHVTELRTLRPGGMVAGKKFDDNSFGIRYRRVNVCPDGREYVDQGFTCSSEKFLEIMTTVFKPGCRVKELDINCHSWGNLFYGIYMDPDQGFKKIWTNPIFITRALHDYHMKRAAEKAASGEAGKDEININAWSKQGLILEDYRDVIRKNFLPDVRIYYLTCWGQEFKKFIKGILAQAKIQIFSSEAAPLDPLDMDSYVFTIGKTITRAQEEGYMP